MRPWQVCQVHCLWKLRTFASGTSSRSTKLIHGGLRYLAMGDLALVREGALERKSLKDHGASSHPASVDGGASRHPVLTMAKLQDRDQPAYEFLGVGGAGRTGIRTGDSRCNSSPSGAAA